MMTSNTGFLSAEEDILHLVADCFQFFSRKYHPDFQGNQPCQTILANQTNTKTWHLAQIQVVFGQYFTCESPQLQYILEQLILNKSPFQITADFRV